MVCLYLLAFIAINGDHLLYKVVAFILLTLQIPILTSDLIFITDSSGTLTTTTLALDATLKSTFVLTNVIFWFLFLYHAWESMRAEEI